MNPLSSRNVFNSDRRDLDASCRLFDKLDQLRHESVSELLALGELREDDAERVSHEVLTLQLLRADLHDDAGGVDLGVLGKTADAPFRNTFSGSPAAAPLVMQQCAPANIAGSMPRCPPIASRLPCRRLFGSAPETRILPSDLTRGR